MVRNVHERVVDADAEAVGALVDSLSSPDDRLWPNRRWPAMRLDCGLEIGSDGGHGPVRYAVARYEPGRLVAFAFTHDSRWTGEHRLEVLPASRAATALLAATRSRDPTRLAAPRLAALLPLAPRRPDRGRVRPRRGAAGRRRVAARPLPVHVRALRSLASRFS